MKKSFLLRINVSFFSVAVCCRQINRVHSHESHGFHTVRSRSHIHYHGNGKTLPEHHDCGAPMPSFEDIFISQQNEIKLFGMAGAEMSRMEISNIVSTLAKKKHLHQTVY